MDYDVSAYLSRSSGDRHWRQQEVPPAQNKKQPHLLEHLTDVLSLQHLTVIISEVDTC